MEIERNLTEPLLKSFKEHLILEERSVATIEKYMRDIRKFILYTKGKWLTKEQVIAYKKKLQGSMPHGA